MTELLLQVLLVLLDSNFNSQPKRSRIDPRTLQQVKHYLYLLTCSSSLTESKGQQGQNAIGGTIWQTSIQVKGLIIKREATKTCGAIYWRKKWFFFLLVQCMFHGSNFNSEGLFKGVEFVH
jgi:hypothetical protein